MEKREVEGILGLTLSEDHFHAALAYAKKKQKRIYEQCQEPEVMQRWYLAMLIGEFIKGDILSEATMNLCRTLRNMEKEHSAKSQSTPRDIHIVTCSAL